MKFSSTLVYFQVAWSQTISETPVVTCHMSIPVLTKKYFSYLIAIIYSAASGYHASISRAWNNSQPWANVWPI
jgi:hypothetical protein